MATDPRTAHALAQHAETARLLGVDFLPTRTRTARVQQQVEAKPEAVPGPTAEEPPVVDVRAHSPSDDERAVAQERLEELRARYEADAPHEVFETSFNSIVFGDGDPCARLMFVGEAPGAEEDKTGKPFVGRAGQLLNKMIEAMGLRREDVYIANVLKTRPPDNRTPTVEESMACAPYLFEQIGIVRPEVIVTLGAPASRLLLDSTEAMGKLRGRWAVFPPPGSLTVKADVPETAVMPTYHPAYLLRSYTPENRQKVWSDLRQAMERLGLA
ncbi:MAG: uracil-DNA glycosylase family protein [Planctomycetota bacterium]